MGPTRRWALRTLAAAAVLCLLISPARGQWETKKDQPEWMHRGRLKWCVAPRKFPTEESQMRPAIDAGYNLVFTAASWYPEPKHQKPLQFLRKSGIHQTYYVCPSSIWYDDNLLKYNKQAARYWPFYCDFFKRYPFTKNACVIQANGKRRVDYAGMWSRRYAGCRNNPDWLQFVKNNMTRLVHGMKPFKDHPYMHHFSELLAAGEFEIFFFDNTRFYNCHCPTCLAKWSRWSKDRFGREMGDPRKLTDPEARLAWSEFVAESNVNFYLALKEHGRSFAPPRFTTFNAHSGRPYHMLLWTKGVADIAFFEDSSRHAPWATNHFAYKSALACTHGGAVGNLTYTRSPPHVRPSEQEPCQPLYWLIRPEFTALGMAEGFACGGCLINSGELHGDLGKTAARYNAFLDRNADVYADLDQGAKIGVALSVASVRRGGCTEVRSVCDWLAEHGLPYEMFVEDDIALGYLRRFDAVVLPDVALLDAGRVRELMRFVEAGGVLIVSGEFAGRNERNRPQQDEEVRGLRRKLGCDAGIEYRAAVDFTLVENYVVVRSEFVGIPFGQPTTEGRAEMRFRGPAGRYVLRLNYLDEHDGHGTFEVLCNGQSLGKWSADKDPAVDEWLWRDLPAREYREGDRIEVRGVSHAGEMARWRAIQFRDESAKKDWPAVVKTPSGRGIIYSVPKGLASLDDAQRLDLLKNSAGQYAFQCKAGKQESVFFNVTRKAGVIAMHLLNFTTTYNESYAVFLNEAQRVRAQVEVAHPEEMKTPQVQFLCFGRVPATGISHRLPEHRKQAPFHLIVSINGKDAATVPAYALERFRWRNVNVPPGVLRKRNTVEFRVEGRLDARTAFCALYIAPGEPAPGHEWSEDGGKTFATDLSPIRGVQQGAYKVRIADKKGGLPQLENCANLAPLRDVVVQAHRAALSGHEHFVLLSSEHPARLIKPELRGETMRFVVPELSIYEVICACDTREAAAARVSANQ